MIDPRHTRIVEINNLIEPVRNADWSRRHRGTNRHGMTLVEVVASLMILGGSVTTMLVAQSASLEQMSAARLQLIAGHQAKELIATWRLEKVDLKAPTSGAFSDMQGWSWRRTASLTKIVDGIEFQEVTLTMIYKDPDRRSTEWMRSYRWLIRDEKK